MERTFTITYTAEERFMLLVGLGFMWAQLNTAPDEITKPITGLIEKLTRTPGQDAPHATTGSSAAHAILSPPAPGDYFVRNKRGDVLVEAPEGAKLHSYGVVGTAKNGKFLKVILANAGTANCFDSQLWPMIERHQGKDLQLWIKPSEDGRFQNIVGVRA